MVGELATGEFPDIVVFAESFYGKLRLHVSDGSYIDIWFSRRIPGRYAYHWERRHIDGSIYRHDNRPHTRLTGMKTFPRHFHFETESNAVESHIPDDPISASRYFLDFIREFLKKASESL